MSLYSMKDILTDAMNRKYGVGYFNATDYHMVRAYIAAAEELKSPIIIGTSEGLMDMYGGYDWIAPIVLSAAHKAKVPVAVHLDHTYRFETIIKAIKNGFGSVMYDGSRLSYQDNIRESAQVAKCAHAAGVHVEFELGCVGGLEDGGVMDQTRYTDPDLVEEYVNRTKADFLAVSIGTVHGVYKSKPCLNIKLLEDIRKEVSIPLVLHGGSGLSENDFKSVIVSGISKINVYTDVVIAGTSEIKKHKDKNYADILISAESRMKEVVMEKIKLFGSDNKA